MSPLARIKADLVEKRLWPIALLLVAALVAVPLLMRQEPEPAPAPPTAVDAPSPEATLAAATSAFAAAAPQARPGAAAKARNPFTRPPEPKVRPSKPKARRDALSAPAPEPSSSSSASSSSSPSSTGTYTPPRTSYSPPSTPRTVQPATTYELLRADIRFDDEIVRDAVRLQPLPGARRPVALYMGPLSGGRGAAFLIAGAEVDGDGRCRPRLRLCTHLVLLPGEQATLTVDDERHTLALLRIRTEQTTSRAKAERFYARESADGRCALDVYDYLGFDVESGTVAPHHDNRGTCEYPGLDREKKAETTEAARMVGTR